MILRLVPPLSDIVFFDTHDILTIFQFDAIYRDILTIFFKCKLGLNAPKFHSRNAYVDIFATKLPIYGIFLRETPFLRVFFSTKMPCPAGKRVPILGTRSL